MGRRYPIGAGIWSLRRPRGILRVLGFCTKGVLLLVYVPKHQPLALVLERFFVESLLILGAI
jgi:hypothetical protein